MIESTVRVTRPRESVTVVELLGEHDLLTKKQDELLLDELTTTQRVVVVDVSEATFIDSSFINLLFRASAAAAERGSSFRLQMGTAAIVQRALEISGALDVLHFVHSREEAVTEA